MMTNQDHALSLLRSVRSGEYEGIQAEAIAVADIGTGSLKSAGGILAAVFALFARRMFGPQRDVRTITAFVKESLEAAGGPRSPSDVRKGQALIRAVIGEPELVPFVGETDFLRLVAQLTIALADAMDLSESDLEQGVAEAVDICREALRETEV